MLRWFERSSIESTELVLESMDVTETGPGLVEFEDGTTYERRHEKSCCKYMRALDALSVCTSAQSAQNRCCSLPRYKVGDSNVQY